MSNIGHLLERYREHPSVVQIAQALHKPNARIQLSGLTGAQGAFVLAATLTVDGRRSTVDGLDVAPEAPLEPSTVYRLPSTVLYIAESKEEAAYLLNDLQGILGDQSVHFFPDSFKRPAFFDDLHPTQMLQRSEVVSKVSTSTPARVNPTPSPSPRGEGGSIPLRSGSLDTQVKQNHAPLPAGGGAGGGVDAGGGGGVVITYPEALFEKVVSPDVLAKSRISIAKGEKLDVDFVIQVLVEYGFGRTDFVYEPGQFSVRGGIIDLFSYGNDLPYRIELFDDEVERISTFEPLTQLSKQHIERVSIVPNLNTRFRQDQKVSLFQVLPANTVLWIKDFQFLLDRLQYCFEKAEQFAGKVSALDVAELRDIFRDRAFLFPGDVVEDVREHAIVFTEKQSRAVEDMLGKI